MHRNMCTSQKFSKQEYVGIATKIFFLFVFQHWAFWRPLILIGCIKKDKKPLRTLNKMMFTFYSHLREMRPFHFSRIRHFDLHWIFLKSRWTGEEIYKDNFKSLMFWFIDLIKNCAKKNSNQTFLSKVVLTASSEVMESNSNYQL